MELKPPKPKKKSNMAKLISWGKMFKTPMLILFLLGTTNCEIDSDSDISHLSKSNPVREKPARNIELPKLSFEPLILSLNISTPEQYASDKLAPGLEVSNSSFDIDSDITAHLRHRHHRVRSEKEKLSEIRYLRRHLNKEIVNFVMSDVLMDGEVENRVHFNGITAKETYVGADG